MEHVTEEKRSSRTRRFLLRGESTVASSGLLLAVIVLCTMGASAWWSARTEHRLQDEAYQVRIKVVSELLSELAGSLLARDEVSRVRLLVADAARTHDLADCRIVLPDGEVVAAARASDITLASVPPRWSDVDVDSATVPPLTGAISISTPITVPLRGRARLDLSAAAPPPAWGSWNTHAGIGLIGAASLFGILLVYRRMRGRTRALSYIRESLLAMDAGESALEALTVRNDLGPEAIAWNELLAERESLRQVLVTKRLLELPSARQERSQDLTSMCDAMAQGLILVDRNLLVNYTNGAGALYLGTTRAAILGESIESCLEHADLLESVRGVASGTLRRSTSIEIRREGEEGSGVLRCSVRPVRRDDESAAMIVIEDVTQQRLADDSRDSFIGKVTHELRTPLTNMLLWLENAMDQGTTDEQATAHALNIINQEARRLERTVSDILSVSELEAGTHTLHRDDVPLNVLFAELEGTHAAGARENSISLKVNLPPKLPVIQADRDKLAAALHNLVGNAIKYTPTGGHVVVDVECNDQHLVVKVIDTGIGLRENERELVFEKFYRGDDERVARITGTGLGLPLAREFVRLHGGEINVESVLDKGSTFTMTVPTLVAAA